VAAERIAGTNGSARRKFTIHKGEGLVNEVFRDEKILTDVLVGDAAIGHNRYSTTGAEKRANIQPFMANYRSGTIATAHNGNLTNTLALRAELQNDGTIFQTTTDSELFIHLIARSRESEPVAQIRDALRRTRGAFSLTMLTDRALVGVRDPRGFRPLAIGKLGDAYFIASETCAFDILSVEYVREVFPNEIVVIDDETVRTGEIKSYWIEEKPVAPNFCIFEYIYFARPDSKIYGENVDKVRRKLGKALAEESPTEAIGDERVTVINVPDSSNTATLGYVATNDKQGNPSRYEIGLIRNHYVGRTFIQPGQDKRKAKVRRKFNVVKGVLKGKNLVVVDDSIVRGTTMAALVSLLREAEPASVHLRISSPPIKFPCKYGMDFPSREELIANQCNDDVEKIRRLLGADTLRYLSVEKLLESVPHDNGEHYCTACFTGDYPVPIEAESTKMQLEH
jgi:amidophosphoribosyltransferase